MIALHHFIFRRLPMLAMGVLYFCSCNAPRLNPLDPQNSETPFAALEGTVQTFGVLQKPISNVTVQWNRGMVVSTDSNGYFHFDTIKPETGWLLFQKNGLKTDSLFFDLTQTKRVTTQVKLKDAVLVESIFVYSTIINDVPDKQTFTLTVSVKITDKNKDVDSVFMEIPNFNFIAPLRYTTSGIYESIFAETDLPIQPIDGLADTDILIIVKDIQNKRSVLSRQKLFRVIRSEINIVSPVNAAPTLTVPTFIWKKFLPGFPFNYTLEIFYNDETNPRYHYSDISSDSTSYTATDTLTSGQWYWVLWCTDNYSNSSRSKKAKFTIP